MIEGMKTEEGRAYLAHINGLRGLAIAAVVMYHLQADCCPGGYFGVDVFLVLTGYLMLWRGQGGWETGYGKWLGKKWWRIQPPCLITALLVSALCILIMVPDRLMAVLGCLGSAALGVSNEFVARSGGYFEPATQENPLMHLWYVGVTLQIYLLFPLLVLLRRKFGSIAWWAMAAVSFALYIAVNYREEIPWLLQHGKILQECFPPYYSTATRLWEPMVAAVALTLPAMEGRQMVRSLLSAAGLLLITVPMWWAETGSPCVFPTVAGCLLMLRYGESGPVGRLLSLRPVQVLGTFSFSLYLVHWPVFALGRYLTFDQTTTLVNALMLAHALLIALLLYLFVESRCAGWLRKLSRRAAWWTMGSAVTASAALWGLLLAFPTLTRYLPGTCGDDVLESAHPILTLRLPDADLKNFPRKVFTKRPRPLGNNTDVPVSFIILGDSHCWHLCYGLDALCRERGNLRGMALNSSCVPAWNCFLERDNGDAQFSREQGEALVNWLTEQQNIRTVIIADFWDLRLSDGSIRDWDLRRIPTEKARESIVGGVVEFCRRLRAAGKRVIVLRDTPFFPGDKRPLDTWQRRRLFGMADKLPRMTPFFWARLREKNEDLFRALEAEGFEAPDPAETLKDGEDYGLRTQEGRFLYRDSNHLSRYGSRRVAEWLLPQIETAPNSEKNKE